jgi:hypothetical protein
MRKRGVKFDQTRQFFLSGRWTGLAAALARGDTRVVEDWRVARHCTLIDQVAHCEIDISGTPQIAHGGHAASNWILPAKETILYTFTGGTDGKAPNAGVIRDARRQKEHEIDEW